MNTSSSPDAANVTVESSLETAEIEEVKLFRDLKFPILLQLSFVHLKLLALNNEIIQTRENSGYHSVADLAKPRKLWLSWKEDLLLILGEKELPNELSSEDFNTVKSFVIEQLDAHFQYCIDNTEEATVFEGIDEFKKKVESLF